MQLQDIQLQVYQRTNKSLAPDPVTAARILGHINDRYREVMRLPGLRKRIETLSIQTEPGQPRYALPAAVTEIRSIFDTTNRVYLQQRELSGVRQRDPSVPAQQYGVAYFWALLSEAGIGQQPLDTTAGALRLVSTSAADTMAFDIEYMGDPAVAGGFLTFTSAVNGVTPVTITPAVFQLFRLQLQAPPVGVVSVYDLASGQVLTTLQGLTTAVHKWVVHLWPTPYGVFTYDIDFTRPRLDLTNPGDEPAFPVDFHDMLVDGACALEMIKMDDSRAQQYDMRWREACLRLRAFSHQDTGDRLVPRGRSSGAFSTIGPWFPPNEIAVY